MSTTIKTGWLNDKNGDKFAPKTLTSQVQTSDGTLIEDKIAQDIQKALDTIEIPDVTGYAKLEDIPTNVSSFNNDAGYLTEHQSLAGYATEKYVDDAVSNKADTNHNHDELYDKKGSAEQVKNDLLNGAGPAYDTLKELGSLIAENVDAIEALETIATNKADKVHNHDELYDPIGSAAAVEAKMVVTKGSGDNSVQQVKTNAQALGIDSAAFNNSIAGCRGYRYKGIDLVDHKIFLTADDNITYQDIKFTKDERFDENTLNSLIDYNMDVTDKGDSNGGYSVGDVFTLKTRSIDLDMIGTITHIQNNIITFAPGTAIDDLTLGDIQKEDTYSDRYSFFVPSKPHVGAVCVSDNSAAFGASVDTINAATGRFSFVAGRDNLAYGDNGIAMGRECVADYSAIALGQQSSALSKRSVAIGFNNVVTGDRAIAIGLNLVNDAPLSFAAGASNENTANARHSFTAGLLNTVNHPGSVMLGRVNGTSTAEDQTIIGRGAKNEGTENALFIIGNGAITSTPSNTSIKDRDRSNAFVVWNDGRTTIGAAPTDGMDATNKDYVDNSINNAKTELSTAINKIPLIQGDKVGSAQGAASSSGSATGKRSFAFGYLAEASSDNTIAMGSEAKATATSAIALGNFTKANGAHSFAVGYEAQANGNHSVVMGRGSQTSGLYTYAIGHGLKTKAPEDGNKQMDQVIVGTYNDPIDASPADKSTSGARFVVGIGTTDTTRKNGLVVWGDGRVTVGTSPTENMDVVTLEYLQSQLGAIAQENELITVEDIDAICGTNMVTANDEVKF